MYHPYFDAYNRIPWLFPFNIFFYDRNLLNCKNNTSLKYTAISDIFHGFLFCIGNAQDELFTWGFAKPINSSVVQRDY